MAQAAMSTLDADRPLVIAAQGGDTAAFAELVKRHSRACFRLAAKTLGNAEDAEDVVQETFTRVYQSLPRFRGDASFLTWALRITHHLAHDHLRGRRRRSAAIEPAVEAPQEAPDRAAGPARESAARDDAAALRIALDLLPVRQKTALFLKVWEGLPYTEIARVLGTTVGAARVYLSLARRELRRRLARLWSDDRRDA